MSRLKTILICFSFIHFSQLIQCKVILVVDSDDLDQLAQELAPIEEKPLVKTKKVSAVKRIVPHEYKTPAFEYDKYLKAIFRPQYRVHKKRSIRNRNELEHIYKLLFQPKIYKGRNPISAILNLVKKNGRPVLRDPLDGKVYDPAHTPSNKPVEVEYLDDPSRPKKKQSQYHFPYFSVYNYWTYDKAVLQDRCPKNLVLHGKVCIYSPHVHT
ncbi:uncharacterized protein LOC125240844 [Leguminivora glycinivorella]|uniref:uncharacterized protein LOC125240844 n=1 Tax=Leguminivora glycinivorella TaxID=1035111 RepID=UPI00200FEC31|nr:uncharacterized protein LOC125240844 [Leguminivora glycinivorella]